MATIDKVYFKKDSIWNQYKEIDLNVSELEGNKRGVSFISLEGSSRLANDGIKGFCHIKFKANFIVVGLDLNQLAIDQLLEIGETIIKVTQAEKECLPNCPIIKESNVSCAVNKQAFFGEVLKGGLVKENDKIILL